MSAHSKFGATVHPLNIQHPTTNIEHPMTSTTRNRWMLDVQDRDLITQLGRFNGLTFLVVDGFDNFALRIFHKLDLGMADVPKECRG